MKKAHFWPFIGTVYFLTSTSIIQVTWYYQRSYFLMNFTRTLRIMIAHFLHLWHSSKETGFFIIFLNFQLKSTPCRSGHSKDLVQWLASEFFCIQKSNEVCCSLLGKYPHQHPISRVPKLRFLMERDRNEWLLFLGKRYLGF